MSATGAPPPGGGRVVEFRDVLRLVRSYWLGILLAILLGAAASYGYTATQPRVYAADARGLVTTGPSSSTAESSVADSVSKSRAESYTELALSRSVAERVVRELDLDVAPAALVGGISVFHDNGSVLIKITAVSSDADEAKRLADAWVGALAAEVDRVEHPAGTATSFTQLVPVESAAAPSSPISPDPRRNLEFGLLAGLLLGIAYALVRHRLDRRIHGATDVAAFGVTVAGVIPLDPALSQQRGIAVEGTVGRHPDRGPAGEAILKLRTNLQFMDIDDPPHTIVVTSPLPGDGKSTVAANLAVALAASERPVVIIDGDLRRPVQAESFGLVEGAGLTDVLIGRVAFDDVVQRPHGMHGVHVLAAGPVPPNPSELLASRAMGRLLDELAQTYTVIIDAPPLLPVTDAAVLTANADGALIVLSSGRTLDVHLSESLANLRQVNGHVLGVVLNKVRRGLRTGYRLRLRLRLRRRPLRRGRRTPRRTGRGAPGRAGRGRESRGGPGQVHAGQVRAGQVRAGQVCAAQVRAVQVRAGQVRAGQVRAGQVCSRQAGSGQVHAGTTGSRQAGSGQDRAGTVGSRHVGAGQARSGGGGGGRAGRGRTGGAGPAGVRARCDDAGQATRTGVGAEARGSRRSREDGYVVGP